jgi:hypothetical protein
LRYGVAYGKLSGMSQTDAGTNTSAESSGGKVTPPLGAYRTFENFLDGLRQKDVHPPQIDRSVMVGKSGTDMAFLTATLRFFDLIEHPTGKVTTGLQRLLSAGTDDRTAVIGELIVSKYPNQVALAAQNGTKDQLLKSLQADFAVSGDSCRKAMTFLLHMMKAGGVKASPFFPEVRAGTVGKRSGSGNGKKKRSTSVVADSAATTQTPPPGDSGSDRHTVELRSGGSLTLEVSVSLFGLSRQDRDFVLHLIDKLRDYDGEETTP